MSDTTAAVSTASDTDSPAAGELSRPRIRAGAAIWGVLLVAVSGWVLWAWSSPVRRDEVAEAVFTMTPLGWTITLVIAVGAGLALLSLAAVIRSFQLRSR